MTHSDNYFNEIIQFLSKIEANVDSPIKFMLDAYKGINCGFDENLNHFVVFLKPESLNYFDSIENLSLLRLIFSVFDKFEISIGGANLLSAEYLRRHRIIEQSYKILNNVSIQGVSACSETVLNKLRKLVEDQNIPVYGGHQFLELHKEFTPYSLCALSHNIETLKLGSGVYVIKVHMFGKDYLLLNAFHPYQIESLTKKGTAVLALECFSRRPMSDIRYNVIGDIFPESAAEGSVRREIYEAQQSLNLPQVNIQYNYVHVSPGVLEGLFQLLHFFSDYERKRIVEYTSTNIGFLLKEKLDLTSQQVLMFEDNPEFLISGNFRPILDSVENLSTGETIDLISSIKFLGG